MTLDLVVFGLSLTSSWGNGHATTYRALLRGLAAEGHRVLFLEREVPWYAAHRDLPRPEFCELVLYEDPHAVVVEHVARLEAADAVIVGSYVPGGIGLIDQLCALRLRRLCFYDIDTPVTLDLLDRGEADYLAPRQIGRFDVYFSFSGGDVLDHLKRVRGARRAEALYCSVDTEAYRPSGAAPRWDLGYLGTYSSDRQPTLDALLLASARRLPDRRFVVAGPQYPADIDWPPNVERIEHLPPTSHAEFYGAQRFTLNVTRAAMRRMGWSPSVRLFEAAACGTPIISDAWTGLDELLPANRAVVIAASAEEVTRAIAMDEPERRRIADEARRIVLAGHTGGARARELVAALAATVSEVRAAAR